MRVSDSRFSACPRKIWFFCHTSLVLSNDIDEAGIKIERVAVRSPQQLGPELNSS
jgi:hypothetical protein